MANETDTRYRYSGPRSGVTLRVTGEDGTVKEVDKALSPGAEVLLPADHPYVRKLRLKRFLTEIPADAPAEDASAKSAGRGKTAAPAADTQEVTTNAG